MTAAQLAPVDGLPVREAARQLGVSVNTFEKTRRAVCQQTPETVPEKLAEIEAA
ncbi:MAG: helix-turn-helix domain-containing protein [Acidobacteriota bacterium]